jgi:hypothetical protein
MRPDYDYNIRYWFMIADRDSKDTPKQFELVNVYCSLDTVNKIKLQDLMLCYCLWVGNKTGSGDQLWGGPGIMNLFPCPAKVEVRMKDCFLLVCMSCKYGI